MAKRGKTSYSPALRLQMKLAAEQTKGKTSAKVTASTVQELMQKVS